MKTFVQQDDITKEIATNFDYEFDGWTTFEPPKFILPNDFGIGLIVGPSGSGKSTILKTIGNEKTPQWNPEKAVCSHFKDADDAKQRLSAVGLNSLPTWMKPYHVLSTGEKFRAGLARMLEDDSVIDEFTSVVDRSVAKSCTHAVRRYVDTTHIKRLVFASCHYDIVEWLQPDWVFDTATGRLNDDRGSLQRPTIELELSPCKSSAWSYFRNHHYLTADINKGARCWIAVWDGVLVGFSSTISFPSGNWRNGWREHRTVVLPEFQGLGLGVRISDAVGKIMVSHGYRYFSKTSHPRMGEYRERSPHWRPTTKNRLTRGDYRTEKGQKRFKHLLQHADRLCYSHEYVGEPDFVRPKPIPIGPEPMWGNLFD